MAITTPSEQPDSSLHPRDLRSGTPASRGAGSGAGDGGGKAGAGSTRMCKQMLTLLGVDVDYAYPGYAGDDPNLYVDIARSVVGGDDAA